MVEALEEQPETWELLSEEGRYLLDSQRAAGERIETKAGLVIGAALASAQFVAAQQVESRWLPIALVSYAASIAAGLWCVRPRTFDNIGLEQLLTGLWRYPKGRAAAEIVNNRNVAIKANARRHQARVTWFWLSLVGLGFGAIMSAGHLSLGDDPDDGQRLVGTCVRAATAGSFICTTGP